MTEKQVRQRRLAQHFLRAAPRTTRVRRTAALAAQTIGFPMVQVNILDDRAQYTICEPGSTAVATIPREQSMCRHVVEAGRVIAVDDLQADPRYRTLPGVQAGLARSYLGVPLSSRESWRVGTLCVIDDQPHRITDEQIELITQFGAIVEDQLDNLRWDDVDSPVDATELRRAIDGGRIVPWYQPIVSLATGQVVSHEALARWQHADGKAEPPAHFIEVAENSDLVVDLDLAVLRRAAIDLARWRRGRPGARVNVNLSTRHLEIPDGVAAIDLAVTAAGVDPAAITLEITETRALADVPAAAAAVAQLRDIGFGVTLDDFGTGWASLDWLLRLPATGIKIDQSLTARLGQQTGDAVHRALIACASELGLDTTIEGLATNRQRRLAGELGYALGQGYLWSCAVPASVVERDDRIA